MRILYLIDSLSGGGAESMLATLVNYLKQNEVDIECDVATLYETEKKYLSGKEFPIHCLKLDSKYSYKGISRLYHFLSARHYDIVHVHLFPSNYFAAIVSLFIRGPVFVYTEHSVWNRRRHFCLLRILEAYVYSRFYRIIAVSELVATRLNKWLPSVDSKVRVIPNCIQIPEIDDAKNISTHAEQYTILFAGRLEYAKGIDILLKALTNVSVPFRLIMAGDGSQKGALEVLAQRLKIRNQVEFLGFRSDIHHLMANADCVVLPSRWEGLPMVVLEAAAVGAPIVASSVGGIPEVIKNRETGWLVPPEDPKILGVILNEVLTNKSQARRIGRKARELVIKNYSVEVLARRTLNLYSDILRIPKKT